MHLKKIFTLVLSLYRASHYAADKTNTTLIPVYKQPGFVRFDFQQVAMPFGEKSMGLMGAHYLIKVNDYLNLGGGFLGGITGQRGGLFTLGLDGNLSLPLSKTLSL